MVMVNKKIISDGIDLYKIVVTSRTHYTLLIYGLEADHIRRRLSSFQ